MGILLVEIEGKGKLEKTDFGRVCVSVEGEPEVTIGVQMYVGILLTSFRIN